MLLALVPTGGLLLTCFILGIPWKEPKVTEADGEDADGDAAEPTDMAGLEDRSSCSICIKMSFAAAAALGIYVLLYMVPFALQSSDEVWLTADASLFTEASLIKESALTNMFEKHNVTTPMTP